MDALKQFERGLITYDELVEDPTWATDPRNTAAWREDMERQLVEAQARYDWKCKSCGNQDQRGRVGDACWYCGGGHR
jgi:hypothetical protein